mgnify:CR=1 FL=1
MEPPFDSFFEECFSASNDIAELSIKDMIYLTFERRGKQLSKTIKTSSLAVVYNCLGL